MESLSEKMKQKKHLYRIVDQENVTYALVRAYTIIDAYKKLRKIMGEEDILELQNIQIVVFGKEDVSILV